MPATPTRWLARPPDRQPRAARPARSLDDRACHDAGRPVASTSRSGNSRRRSVTRPSIPRATPSISHSYIFNFGLPFKSTGLFATFHQSSMLDLHLGIDTGANTTFGAGDDNAAIAGNVRGRAEFSRRAPDRDRPQPYRSGEIRRAAIASPTRPCATSNDLVLTWKATERLTLTTEANYARDDGFKANGYGLAQYVQYSLDATFSLVVARRSGTMKRVSSSRAIRTTPTSSIASAACRPA
ncbi:MAG: outer membrane beta-barrel protein [Pseudomonadota bacterium]